MEEPLYLTDEEAAWLDEVTRLDAERRVWLAEMLDLDWYQAFEYRFGEVRVENGDPTPLCLN